MAMTWEQAQAHIEALNQQVAQLTQQNQGHTDLIQQLAARATAADESHQQLHREMATAKGQLANSKSGFRLIDPKTMKPEKLGSKDGPTWKQWSEDTRAFVENLDVGLAKLLRQQEGREEPITETELELLEDSEDQAAQLGRVLRLNTEGHINTMVKTLVERE